jgi:DNA-binding FrmR family transcriptional regulator
LKYHNRKGVYHYSSRSTDPDPEYTDVAEFVLYPETRINHFEEKAACASAHDIELNPTPLPDDEICQDVVDVTSFVRDGRLVWKAPKGRWRIYRLGASLTGKQNHPAPPEATGFEVDKLDKDAWTRHFRNYLDMNKEALQGKLGAKGINYVLVDSYEAGHQNWTPKLREEFISRRGYDPRPWYPVLTGMILKSVEESERFLWDWRKTIGELFEENYAVLDSIVKNEYIVKTEIARTFIGAVLKIGLLWIKAPLEYFILATAFDTVLVASGYCLSYRKIIGNIKDWKFDKKLVPFMIRESFPLMLSGAAVIIYQRIDQVMIKNMIDDDRYCVDILTQISAAKAALSSLSKELLEDHINTCVVSGIKNGDEKIIKELCATVDKFI